MTVLVLSEMFPNPENAISGVFVLDQMRALRRRGVNFQVIVPVPWIPPLLRSVKKWQAYARVPSEGRVEDFPVRYLQLPMFPKGWLFWLSGFLSYLWCRRVVRDYILRYQVDLIQAHAIMPLGFAAVLLGREFKLPVACTVHGSDINVQPFTNWRNRWAAEWALKRVSHLFAVSLDLKQKIVALVGARQIQVVRNGADSALFYPLPKNEARARLGLPPDKKIILFIGKLVPIKNVPLLLDAFRRLSTRDALLYVVGDGILAGELQAAAHRAGIQDRCHFVGCRPHGEVATWLAAADCLVLTSNMEGLPTILPEAMLCRTPVVATRVGGIPEVVVHGETGLLVPPGDAGQLAAAVDTLLNNPDFVLRLTENAATRANRDLTWEANATQALQAYQQLMRTPVPDKNQSCTVSA